MNLTRAWRNSHSAPVRVYCKMAMVVGEVEPEFKVNSRRGWRLGKIVLSLCGMATILSGSVPQLTGEHCRSHAVAARHGQHSQHASHAKLQQPSHESCSHCPAVQCASLAPCNSTAPFAVVQRQAPARLNQDPLPQLSARFQAPSSHIHQPPTPPPQTLS